MVDVIDLQAKREKITEYWSPRIVGQLNDYLLKMAKIEGDFVWHSHPETDELFFVVAGHLRIDFRDHSIDLAPGQLCVVPASMEHEPFADTECTILMIEPVGTLNTGDAGGARTVSEPEWI
ncbi:MAG: cupin domain-containing protein [Chloroflexi bacterium]|nr:cupin domain-containing protein [Chloroflexota bacterium]